MNEEKLISVIVPVYNVERYLAACLDSILSQSYRNIEVIVIDDGSTDFSLKIAQTYQENEDRVIVYSYPNAGPSEARNRGINVATGDFIMFVDSDDLLLPYSIETLMNILEKENGDMVEGRFIRGETVKKINPSSSPRVEVFNTPTAISNVLYQKKLLPSVSGKLYKKSIFESLRFEKGILYEDLNIIYYILERCNKILWTDFPVYFYRQTPGSIVNSWHPKRLDVLKVTENIENYIAEKYPDLLPSAIDRRLSANFNMYALCSINGDKENAQKCWQTIKNKRKHSIFNPKVRLKNKAGIILSFLGPKIFSGLSHLVYKK